MVMVFRYFWACLARVPFRAWVICLVWLGGSLWLCWFSRFWAVGVSGWLGFRRSRAWVRSAGGGLVVVFCRVRCTRVSGFMVPSLWVGVARSW